MFARSSKQLLQQDTYKQWQYSFEALHLPWLCPVLYDVASRLRTTSTITRTQSTKQLCLSRPCFFQPAALDRKLKSRGLASATQAVQSIPEDDFIPFEMAQGHYQPQMPRHLWPNPNNMSILPDFTPDSVLMISDKYTTRSPNFRSASGISGNVAEIVQTLHACIQVDHLERAASLMRRLNIIYKSHAPELLAAHNDYLRGLVHSIERTKDPRFLKNIHMWFEKDIRKAGVVPDASTYALMILATVHDTTVKDAKRTINRYISLAKDAGVWEDTRSIVSIISDEKHHQNVTQIVPFV